MLPTSCPSCLNNRFFIIPAKSGQLTYYWLGVRKSTTRSERFHEALHILANGFPNPDHTAMYGLQSIVNQRQEDYQSHLSQLVVSYRQHSITVTDDAACAAFADLLLNNEVMAYIHSRQEIVGLSSSSSSSSSEGAYAVVEELIFSLRCPPVLWIRAVYVFFEHHRRDHLARAKDLFMSIHDFSYAGKTFQEMVQNVHDRPPSTDVADNDDDSHVGQPVHHPDQNLTYHNWSSTRRLKRLVLPIPRSESTRNDVGLFSGILGQFGESWSYPPCHRERSSSKILITFEPNLGMMLTAKHEVVRLIESWRETNGQIIRIETNE